MNIWNIDVCPRQKYLTPTVSCCFISFSDKVSYLLDSIVLSSQIIATMISTVKSCTIEDILKGEFNWNMYEITPACYVIKIYIYCTDYILNKMIVWRKSLLNTLMQIFMMLRHLVAEISRFKFDDYRVIRTGANDLKLFLGCVYNIIKSWGYCWCVAKGGCCASIWIPWYHETQWHQSVLDCKIYVQIQSWYGTTVILVLFC